ncbi:hypothetical protein [Pseudonocardia sp. NPDC049154]|uniref:hypothetical protein n=1 Tax=Pseudonocardia sp. NPDC049154 TaxID=3155501 RepID=UPI00340F51B9
MRRELRPTLDAFRLLVDSVVDLAPESLCATTGRRALGRAGYALLNGLSGIAATVRDPRDPREFGEAAALRRLLTPG